MFPSYKKTILSGLLAALISGTAHANPTGPKVVHGNVTFGGSAGELIINNSPGAIINWQGFSIGDSEITRFNQQNNLSSVLNRVVSADPSKIFGQLLSNGRVFLINPNGIVFGRNARIDTAGLVASTLDIADADFIAGNLAFEGNGGSIQNQGYIKAGKDGHVVFIAPDIENSGVIQTDGGHLLLASGRSVNLTSLDDDHISFEVTAPAGRVVNLGSLLANNGAVSIYTGRLRQQGRIQANRLWKSDDGMVYLFAEDHAEVGGTITASGSNKTSGGRVTILGDRIDLKGAEIDATGTSGGEVLVGGDYQGQGSLPTATNTTVDAATNIKASATTFGNGGRVIVWSDNHTEAHGLIQARGGPSGGDGGFVETSGKKTLEFTRAADVSAPQGKAGTWLLDPEDIDIDSAKAQTIETALNAGSNVSIKTSDTGDGEGNITVNASITKSEGDDASLSMTAHNRIDVNKPITSTSGKLDVSLKAGNKINVNADINTNGGGLNTTITGTSAESVEEAVEELADVDEIDEPDVDTDEASDDSDVDDIGESLYPDSEFELAAELEVDELVVETETSQLLPDSGITNADLDAIVEADQAGIEGEAELADLLNDEQGASLFADITTGGGEISIDAGDQGIAFVGGNLDASNHRSGETGGQVAILGGAVVLSGSASVDVSGDDGGGEILVGGDYQGSNPDVLNARYTYAGEGAKLNADGGQTGDGGRVIVWADDTTVFHGDITARGGDISGDGGFAEVSGKKYLTYSGFTDLRANNGATGTLLLDPGSWAITAGGGGTGAAGTNTYADSNLGTDLAGANVAILTANAGNDAAPDSITFEAGSHVTWASGNQLTLNSSVDIAFNGATINGGTTGSLVAIAGGNITQSVGSEIIVGTLNATADGDITLTDANNDFDSVTLNGATVQITDIDDFEFSGDSSVNNLTATSGAGITDAENANINVNSIAAFQGTSIALGDGTNTTNFGQLELDITNSATITEDSGTEFRGTTQVGALTLTSNGDITDENNAEVTVTNRAHFLATNITLGDETNTTNFGTLTLDISNDATITEDSGTNFVGTTDVDNDLTLTSSGDIGDDNNANVIVDGTASFSATNITLGDETNTTNFDRLTINTSGTGNVSIVEDSATAFSGSSSIAGNLSLTSAGNITDLDNADLTVGGLASLNSSTFNITLGDETNTTNFDRLTINTSGTGNVSIVEDSATAFSGSSSIAGNLSLTSAGNITDLDNADLTVGGLASLNSSTFNITLGDETNTTNFDRLTVNTAGTGNVSIAEDSGTLLTSKSSVAGILTLASAGALTNDGTANVSVANLATLSGTSITLGNEAGDEINFGTLNFNSAGSVTIIEDSAMTVVGADVIGNNSAGGGGLLQASSPLTISGVINVGDTMRFIASGSGADVDHITINNNAIVRLNSASNDRLRFEAGDDIVLDTGEIQTTGGGTHTVELVADTEGDTTSGTISQSQATTSITTNNLFLDAAQSIGTMAQSLMTEVATIAARITGTGDLFLDEADNIEVGTVTDINGGSLSGLNTSAQNGKIDIDAVDVRIDEAIDVGTGTVEMALTGTLTDGDAGLDGNTDIIAGTLKVDGATQVGTSAVDPLQVDVATAEFNNISGPVSLVAEGATNGTQIDLTVQTDAAGDVVVTSSDKDLLLTDISTHDGAVDVRGIGQSIDAVLVDTSNTDDDTNDIILLTTGAQDIRVDNVRAGLVAGDVLISSSGAILEIAPDATELLDPPTPVADISGHQLELVAISGIGVTLPLDPVEINATDLAATTLNGGINVFDTDGGVLITDVDVVGSGTATQGLSISGSFPGDIELEVIGDLTVDAPISTTAGGNISFATVGVDNDLTINGLVTGGGAGSIVDLSSQDAAVFINASIDNTGGNILLNGGQGTRVDASVLGAAVDVRATNIGVTGGNFSVRSGATGAATADVAATDTMNINVAGKFQIDSFNAGARVTGGTVAVNAGGSVDITARAADAVLNSDGTLSVSGFPDINIDGGNPGNAAVIATGNIDMSNIDSLDLVGGPGGSAGIESDGQIRIGTLGRTRILMDSGSNGGLNAEIHGGGSVFINGESHTMRRQSGSGVQVITDSADSIYLEVTGDLDLSSQFTSDCSGLECLFVNTANVTSIFLKFGRALCNGSPCNSEQVTLFLDPKPSVDQIFEQPQLVDLEPEAPDTLEDILFNLLGDLTVFSQFGNEEENEILECS